MATRNYRQAKRAREETRKKKHLEKIQKKLSRGAAPEADQQASANDLNSAPEKSS